MAIGNRGSLSLPGIFGSDASTTIPTPPTPGNSYRDTSLSDGDMAVAWPYSEIVFSEKFNQVMFLVTSLLKQLEQQGILSWSTAVDYPIGAICFGSDSQIYSAIQASVHTSPKDPTTQPTYWQSLLTRDNLLGAWVSKSHNTVYQAATSGFVVGYAGNVLFTVYSDSSNPPTTERFKNGESTSYAGGICPVKKGDYWKTSDLTGDKTISVFWIPLEI
jgi:hypothetical protein